MSPSQVTCPHCRTILQSAQPLPVSKRVRCRSCGTSFTIGMDRPAPLSAGAPAVPAGIDLPAKQGVSAKALLSICMGALLFLGAGVALAVYCFSGGGLLGKKAARGDSDQRKPVDNQDLANKVHPKPRSKPPGPLVHLSQEQQDAVNRAIARGVTFLKYQQNPNGTWTAANDTLPDHPAGITTLVGLTLLECDVPKEDPAIQQVTAYLRGREASNNQLATTYDLSLAALFLDRLDDPQDRDLIRKLALRLVAGQTASGGWTYGCPVLTDADSDLLAKALESSRNQFSADVTASKLELRAVDTSKLRLVGDAVMSDFIKNLPVWRSDTVVGAQPDADNSNTQFAILGLWAAKTRGLPVERALALVVQRFHKAQNADGSWGYEETGPRRTTNGLGSSPAPVTCSGLLGLAVGQGLVNEARGQGSPARQSAAQQDPAIQLGLDYLAQQLGDPHQPWQDAAGAPLVDQYFLWSVERVGVIFQLPKVGGKDWYGWGAEKLVANQKIDGDKGSWEDGGYYGQNPTINTCFALLFLKQANLARDLTDKLMLQE